jgi:molybdenum cofactor cytidylyltransferase
VKFGVVILAAGASKRMGKPKLLLDWGGSSVVAHLISQWTALGASHVAVVIATEDKALALELDRIAFPAADRIVNPAPEQGMFSSIKCAARWPFWNKELTNWTIVLGDQPHLPAMLLRELVEFAARHSTCVCQPSFEDRPRHPVILPKAVFERLASSTNLHLKDFLRFVPVPRITCPMTDPALDLDMDHPDDYKKALALFPPVRSAAANVD